MNKTLLLAAFFAANSLHAETVYQDDFTGASTRRTGALLARSRSAAEMVAHPLVLDVAEQVLWPSKTTFQLHLTQAISRLSSQLNSNPAKVQDAKG